LLPPGDDVEDEVWLRLLGPVEIRNGRGGWLRPRGPQLRVTLASLGLSAGRVVPLDELIDALWEERSPRSARASVQILMARLRKALGDVPDCKVDRYGDGYLLQVAQDRIDVHRFRSLVREARQTANHQEAISMLGRALTLWRGPALTDVSATPRVEAIRAGLAEEQLSAAEARFGHLLDAGRHAEAAEEIPLMLAAHPLAERLAGLLMVAWYRSGRQADALGVYRNMRTRLADGLGVEPGPDLQRLHQLILEGDHALAAPEDLLHLPINGTALALPQSNRSDAHPEASRSGSAVVTSRQLVPALGIVNGGSRPAGAASVAVTPRELPPPPTHFTGRRPELRSLTGWLDAGTGAGGPVVLAVCGPPGSGKTALALRWAREVQQRFPDGQLHVDLGGFGPSSSPAAAAEAMSGILESLGVAAGQTSHRPDAGTGLFRSLLADRKVLIVLDNARDEAQVRPLLPGSPTCVVLVTSRSDLGGLVASHGVRLLTLDMLSAADSRQLLASRLGAEGAGAEAEALDELVSLCAGLPLALAIAASRAVARPAFPLAALAAGLRGPGDRLDGLDTGDQTTSLRAVFSWSYRVLSEPAAQMFRRLAAHPGPDASATAAASMAACSAAVARASISELARANLVQEPVPGRFAMHELLRVYAADLAGQEEYSGALRRVLDYYLRTAHAAVESAYPHWLPVTLPVQQAANREQFADPLDARAWLEAEEQVLLAAAAAAAAASSSSLHAYGWQLPAILREHFLRSGSYAECAQSQRTALAAATRHGDRGAQALAHRSLGDALVHLDLREDAERHLDQAFALYCELADQAGQAACHCALAQLSGSRGDHDQALHHAQHALRLYREAGDLAGEAAALNGVGWDYALLGNNQQAVSYCTKALKLHRKSGNRLGQAMTLDSLGYCSHQAGRHTQAAALYRQALDAYADAGDRFNRAYSLIGLGDAHRANGDALTAREAWQQALDILDDLQHPDARSVRAKLQGGRAVACCS
jgi:DNA-binding SARP family transcriptional activator/tetratricopeptide (TPR) repeat protein